MSVLLLLFLAAIGVDWPELPYNASLADLIFIPLAILVLTRPRTRWTWHRADLAVAIYLLGTLPSIAVSPEPRQSAMEMVRQLYLVAIYVIVVLAVRHGLARTIGKGLALGGAILSIAGLTSLVVVPWTGEVPAAPLMGEFMQLPYLGETLRLRGLTASQAMFACLLTATAPFAIAWCTADRARQWCAAAVAMIAAAAFTFSHAIAGFAVAALMAAWPSFAAYPRSRRVAVAGVALIVLALNFAATISIRSASYGAAEFADSSSYHYGVDSGRMQFGGAVVTYDVMSYARIKQVAWRTFVDHPIAGIGLDRFYSATERAHAEGLLTPHYRVIDPHSTLLGRLAESGIIGGVTLLLLWAAWAVMAREVSFGEHDAAIGYAAAAALAGLMVSSLNADIMNFRFVWVLAGLMRGLQEANGMVTASGRAVTAAAGTR